MQTGVSAPAMSRIAWMRAQPNVYEARRKCRQQAVERFEAIVRLGLTDP